MIAHHLRNIFRSIWYKLEIIPDVQLKSLSCRLSEQSNTKFNAIAMMQHNTMGYVVHHFIILVYPFMNLSKWTTQHLQALALMFSNIHTDPLAIFSTNIRLYPQSSQRQPSSKTYILYPRAIPANRSANRAVLKCV